MRGSGGHLAEVGNIGKDLFINTQQKDIIKSCIEELEKLAEFDHDQEPPTEIDKYISASARSARHEGELEEYEEVQFSTEEIIDSDDLEHIHVVNTKSEQRRLSSQFDNFIQLKEVNSGWDEVGGQKTLFHTGAQDEIHTDEKLDTITTSEMMQNFEEKINQTVERREIITTTERMDFEETICQTSDRDVRDEEETQTPGIQVEESILKTSNIQDLKETETQTTEMKTESITTHRNIQEDFEATKSETSEGQTSIFLTEMDDRAQSKLQSKRERNRTIDYHSLPSLYWEASVQNYHERQYVETEQKTEQKTDPDQLSEDDKGGIDLAKDGLSLILKK